MSSCLFWVALIAVEHHGYSEMPAQISGAYWSSCNTSYCKAGEVHCTPQAKASSILNRPTGHGYSVTYNYGLQPDSATRTWSASSSAYNYGGYGMK